MAVSGPDGPSPTGGVQPNSPAADSASGSDTAAVPAQEHHSHVPRERDFLTHLFVSLGKLLAVVVTLVTLLGGVVTLLFQVDPTLEPCIGGGQATFTAVEVAPDYPLAQYIRDTNNGQTPTGVPSLVGAEVRYNYSASNLSGHDLRLYTTLEQIGPNGDIAAPPGPPPGPTDSENLYPPSGLANQPPPVVTPDRCSLDSSGFDWVQLPKSNRRHHRYQIVLEFYRGALDSFTDRVGVGRTPIFDY
jgi:hypothetical protein